MAMNKVGGMDPGQIAQLVVSSEERRAKARDKAIEGATSWGIGPVRVPKFIFSNKEEMQKAQERFERLQKFADMALESLVSAFDMKAGR